jgi:hypothetical protein
MAKIKLSAIMSEIRGKLNGSVFSKNRGGAYIRNKVTPSNPQTQSQMNVRGIFAGIASAWSTLTEDNRLSFNSKVSQYAKTDIFGDLRNPSGKALYQRLNQNLTISNQGMISNCPDSKDVPFGNLISAVCDLSEPFFNAESLGALTGNQVVIWATPGLSQGTTFVKNKLRQVAVFTGDDATNYDFITDYVAKFGTPVAGANIYVGMRVINENGQASPLEVVKATVQA